MFEKNEIKEIIEGVTKSFQGSYIMINVIGQVKEPRGNVVPFPPGMEDLETKEKKEPETILEKPFKRIVNTKEISTIWEHEKGCVIRLGYEQIITDQSIEVMALECGMTS